MGKHILFFEPRTEGHHLGWLQLFCEALLAMGFQLTLAIDDRTNTARERIADKNTNILKQVSVISVYETQDTFWGGSKINALAHCFQQSGADEIFCNTLDEFSSSLLRRAAFGLKIPSVLRGKLSGIFIRPRPLDPTQSGVNNRVKKWGFRRLDHHVWFNKIFFLDEFLVPQLKGWRTSFHFLPDPWMGDYSFSQKEARDALGIPEGRVVLLHYGADSPRKGLDLLLDALQGLSGKERFFLIAAGLKKEGSPTLARLKVLEEQKVAKVFNYYLSDEEEKQCFAATDFVTMPYNKHYGSSGVLSQAAAAAKPVIASDYHLLGKRVKTYNLGLTFANGDSVSLREQLEKALNTNANAFEGHLRKYAEKHSPTALKKVFDASFI